jgi:Cu+-exporting ATPase
MQINKNNLAAMASHQTVYLNIKGMTCASCVLRIEQSLISLDGIFSATVTLTTERARIDFDSSIISEKAFAEVIEKNGYSVQLKNVDTLKFEPDYDLREEIKTLRRNAIFSIILTVPLFIISMAKMLPSIDVWMTSLFSERGWMVWELCLATPIIFFAGRQFFKSGWAELRHFNPGMNSLVIIGASTAYFYSLVALIEPKLFPPGTNNSYFEASGIIITLILIGRYLEAIAKGRASQAIKTLMQLQSRTAHVIRSGREIEIPIEEVAIDDLVSVRPGECIAVDGIVIRGSSYVDESMITGESVPVGKKLGSIVTGGTFNKSSAFTFRVLKIGADLVLSRIISMIENAQQSKPPIQMMADKIASIFVPVVICIAIITFCVWQVLGPDPTLNFAFINSVSVLLIACPCAIGLAAPTAIMVGTGRGAEIGVLFRKGSSLEALANIDTVLLDKTGTITNGNHKLTNFKTIEGKSSEVLRLIAAAESLSEHPIAKAIVVSAREKGLEIPMPKVFNAEPGLGIDSVVEGYSIQVGDDRYMKKLGIDLSPLIKQVTELADQGDTTVFGVIDGKLAALISVSDTLKDDSQVALMTLQKMGLETIMVTGDNKLTAQAIANQTGINRVFAEYMPEQKVDEIIRLQAMGKRIAFVGDGINDAPALAQADIGIAIGTGTDIAIETGDVILMSGKLTSLVNAIVLSQRTMSIIRLNFLWAYAYNVALIPIAAGALFPLLGVLLSPMLAAGAMSLSSIFVVTNSLRLRSFKTSKLF